MQAKTEEEQETMQTTIPGVIACGMDVHKDKIDACVRIGDGSADGKVIIQTFSTMRKALYELRDWLASLKCFKVLMESTGVFWMPIYWILEEVSGLNIGVGNARDLKNAPGRPKTDKEDAKWLSRLCMFGLVLKSFIVARPFRALREYTRYYKKLVQERARQINRVEKLLQMNGFKLSSVLSNITGVSGAKILTKLADKGTLSVADIQAELDKRCKHTAEEIEYAINGVMKLTSRPLLKLQLKKIESCDKEMAEVYEHMLRLSKEHIGAIRIISSIPGMSELSAMYIIAEIGTDLTSFKTANHLAAWAGLAPKENQSADKARPSKTQKANQYVRSLMIQCAWAATKTRNTRLSLWYWRNVKRLGDKKAITAVARKLLCYVYAMLKSGALYDKSLDVAYTNNIEAQKLDTAQKVGRCISEVLPINKSGHSKDAQLAQGLNCIHEEPGLAITQPDNEQKPKNGIKSPNKTVPQKKKGRPKKSAAPG
ncbi:MAG: IS110 family transposase [Peptococcaceae bacterium]|nr:IS110 family transposase [Peptococcaceae bacterium]